MELKDIKIKLIQTFKNAEVKKLVLEEEWLKKNEELKIDSIGFCYAASEVIYRLTGGKIIWKKMAISKRKWAHGGHCYLINKETQERLDITADQYIKRNISIPYNLARAGGFRTKGFSKSARILADMAGLLDQKIHQK